MPAEVREKIKTILSEWKRNRWMRERYGIRVRAMPIPKRDKGRLN